jgi:DNA-directed RNA polymerase subunit E'/Rpb7
MKLVSPYRYIKQYTKISLEPYYMNCDIRNNMKLILKKNVEKKCNKNGFVDEVYRIIDYSDGYMPPENLNGNVLYNIIYHCKICIPVENTMVIGLIKIIHQELIIAINGPIMFFIPKDKIDINVWSINDGFYNIIHKKKLVVGNYIKIQIINKRLNLNDTQIKTIGNLIDFATEEEIDRFYGNKIIESHNNIDSEEQNNNKSHNISEEQNNNKSTNIKE